MAKPLLLTVNSNNMKYCIAKWIVPMPGLGDGQMRWELLRSGGSHLMESLYSTNLLISVLDLPCISMGHLLE